MTRIAVRLRRYEPRLRMQPHVDGCWRMSVLVQGEMAECGSSWIRLSSAGRVSWKAPDFVHTDHFGPRGALIVSAVLPERLQSKLRVRFANLHDPGWYATDGLSLQGLRLASALARSDGGVAEDALRQLLGQFSATRAPRPRVPACVHQVLHRLGTVDAPALDELAAQVGMHPISMNRAFRRVHGCSITAYRQRRRITAAARALMESRDDLTDVALAHGFSDLSHMTRLFHRELDAPPGAFRHSMQQLRSLDSQQTVWDIAI